MKTYKELTTGLIDVLFNADIEIIDTSFDHAFGTHHCCDYEVGTIDWNRKDFSEVENRYIRMWLKHNIDEVKSWLIDEALNA